MDVTRHGGGRHEGGRGGIPGTRQARSTARRPPCRSRRVPAAFAPRPAADGAEHGVLHRSDHRRTVGRRQWQRQAERVVGVRLGTAHGTRAGSREALRGLDPADPCAGVSHPGGTGGDRCRSLRADGCRGSGARRRRPAGRVARVGRGVGAVAGQGVRRLHLRIVRADRDRPARGAAARGGRGTDRCRPQTRDVPGVDLGVGGAGPPASAAGAPDRPVDARVVPVGASGRRVAGVPAAQVTAGRGARHRAVVGAAQARGADRHGGRGARITCPGDGAGRRDGTGPGGPWLRAAGEARRGRVRGRLPRLPARGRPRSGDQGHPAGARQRCRFHPSLPGRSSARRSARAPLHRSALRLLA